MMLNDFSTGTYVNHCYTSYIFLPGLCACPTCVSRGNSFFLQDTVADKDYLVAVLQVDVRNVTIAGRKTRKVAGIRTGGGGMEPRIPPSFSSQ